MRERAGEGSNFSDGLDSGPRPNSFYLSKKRLACNFLEPQRLET